MCTIELQKSQPYRRDTIGLRAYVSSSILSMRYNPARPEYLSNHMYRAESRFHSPAPAGAGAATGWLSSM
jgi:hypothetical protein